MIIALTGVDGWTKEKSFFLEDIFSHETMSYLRGSSSELLDPNAVLTKLGLQSDYLDKPPFRYIRSYATIWEFYLVGLHLANRNQEKRIRSVHEKMCGKPSNIPPQKCLGRFARAVGNTDYTVWKNHYNIMIDSHGAQNRDVANLKKQTSEFVEHLISKPCAIRQYSDQDLTKGFVKKRQMAAKTFFEFLIKGKIEDKNIVENLYKQPLDKKLKELYIYFDHQKDTESCKHILSVSLLLCLYGRKDSSVSTTFFNFVKEQVGKLNDSKMKSNVYVILQHSLKTAAEAGDNFVVPPLKKIYKEHDRINIMKRISSWFRLLEGTIDAQNEQ